MTAFTMPSLGADMDEGLLQEWLVSPGDHVHKGDVVAVVETDKAAIEVECFESGTVGRLLVPPGTRVPVGAPLAMIEDDAAPGAPKGAPLAPKTADAETAPASAPEPVEEPATHKPPERATADREPTARHERPKPRRKAVRKGDLAPEPEPTESRERATEHPTRAARPPARPAPEPSAEAGSVFGAGPLVRHLAVLRGVDLTTLHGTGRGGRITRTDVEHAAPPIATRPRVTPYARRLARDLGIDLTEVRGTGEDGAVRAADVRTAVRARSGGDEPEQPDRRRRDSRERTPTAVTSAGPEQRTDAMRRAIADLMSRSKREIPHYYLSTTIDLTAAEDWRRRTNRGRTPADRLVPAALLLKAAAVAARDVPELNGHWQNDGFVPGTEVNLGVAVSLRQGGLLAPVIHRADTLPPDALMADLKDLVQRARRGRLRGTETTGATLTVTNLGEQGVETVFGVIHPPQVALVGFGAVLERPWATGGLLGVRPLVTVTLAADHRATDGAVGARYLTAVDRLLQRPEEL
ncbi:2-oxo acid dehydrogenase subunit E2 [Streptomyces sp. NPDC058751]|uniref:2-oxo acid dehydrogenase subunit E2 n=1 Tax=Streptomyces sp. NPDC058751 TaxID=3346623 RepID=UPI003679483E